MNARVVMTRPAPLPVPPRVGVHLRQRAKIRRKEDIRPPRIFQVRVPIHGLSPDA